MPGNAELPVSSNLVSTIKTLSDTQQQLLGELQINNLCNVIPTFNGDSVQNFRRWAKEIDKNAATLDQPQIHTLITRTLQSQADLAYRNFKDSLDELPSWQDTKKHLTEIYITEGDIQLARSELFEAHQQENETIPHFWHRLQQAAKEAYPDQNLQNPDKIQELISIFRKGLKDTDIMAKLYEKTFTTTEEPVRIATSMENAKKAAKISSNQTAPRITAFSVEQKNVHFDDSTTLQQLTDKLQQVISLQQEINNRNSDERRSRPSTPSRSRELGHYNDRSNSRHSSPSGHNYRRHSPHHSRDRSSTPNRYRHPRPTQHTSRPQNWNQRYDNKSSRGNRPPMRCFNCYQQGHTARRCPSRFVPIRRTIYNDRHQRGNSNIRA